jgi:hypothetical protein
MSWKKKSNLDIVSLSKTNHPSMAASSCERRCDWEIELGRTAS